MEQTENLGGHVPPVPQESRSYIAQPFHSVAFDGCPSGSDSQWNITWANTALNETDEQQCPGGGESRSIGVMSLYLPVR